MNALALRTSDLTAVDDEPRIKDVRIGACLGMGQPLNIRKVIEANRAELERYGNIFTQHVKNGERGRPSFEYYLNEGQTLLLCMFSRTDRAADVREQVIKVFMAYRRGALKAVDAPPQLFKRGAHPLDRAIALQSAVDTLHFVKSLARVRRGRRPKFWSDLEVRAFLVEACGQMSMPEALSLCAERFGPERTPSRSAIYRFWDWFRDVACIDTPPQ